MARLRDDSPVARVGGPQMTGAVEIRLLKPGDEAVLDRVAPDLFDGAIDAKACATFLNEPRFHLAVALDAGVVVGFASAVHYHHPDKPVPELWVDEVAVAPSHRQRGIASWVLRALFDRARELGCGEAWVLTDRSNPAAMRLYSGVGGRDTDCVMFSFPLGDSGHGVE